MQLADAYIDGELAPSEIARFEAHLAGCTRCEAAVDAARSTKTLLASAPVLHAPRSFVLTPQMVTGGERQRMGRPVALRLAQTATAVAVIAFATILTIDVTGGGGSNGPQPLAASEQATSGKAVTGVAPAGTASPAPSFTPEASPSPTGEPTRPPIAPPPTEGAGAQGFSPSPSASPTPSPTAVPPATAQPSPTTIAPPVPHTGPGFGAQDTSGGERT
ncbi:MAG TPA: zf-HC2 domain-containing protein, partial [Tepidiformaceae bacterium]|nr:zf-HC2 domain-containing protein [Tepidiformaceae bacterium]